MMKINSKDLTGSALDWAVAKSEHKTSDCEVHGGNVWYGRITSGFIPYSPSADWAQAGVIIEREGICIKQLHDKTWKAEFSEAKLKADGSGYAYLDSHGETPLSAAMRCYVVSKLGAAVEVPDDLAACLADRRAQEAEEDPERLRPRG